MQMTVSRGTHRHEGGNPLMIRVDPLKSVVWIYDAFDNNFGIKNDFT